MNNVSYNTLVQNMVEYLGKNNVKVKQIPTLISKYERDVLNEFLKGSKEVYILKNNGEIEDFDHEKLFLSIANASDEIKEPLTSGDIHSIVNEAIKIFLSKNTPVISSCEIREAVLRALKKLGFLDIYKSYRNSTLGRWIESDYGH